MAAAGAGISRRRRRPQFRQRRGRRALRAGRRHHAGPHHPHQGLAADRAGAGRRQARRFQARRTRRRSSNTSRATAPISSATMRALGGTKTMVDPLPRVVLVPGLGLFGLGDTRQDAHRRRRSRRDRRRSHHRRRGDRHVRIDQRSRHVRLRILAAGARQARQREAIAARRPDRGRHRRGRRDRRRDREGVRRRRRRGRAARRRRQPPRSKKPRRSATTRWR